MKTQYRQHGLALWELAVVVIIVAILLAVALPAYRHHVLKSHRAEARGILADILTAQENFRVYCGKYAQNLGAAEDCQAGSIKLGRAVNAEYFSAELTLTTETGFLASVYALGNQQDDIACKTMTVQVVGAQATFNPAECWK
jgi:type IV pilus assembly protein PilE